MKFIKYLILLVFLTTPFAVSAQEKAPFTALDLVQIKRISGPEVSPDGRYVAFVVRETDMEEDRGRSDIWLLDLRAVDAGPIRLTTHAENDFAPKWSSDSRTIYFLSDRVEESAQVWRIPVSGGEAAQVTHFPVDVETFKLSPDNGTLGFTATAYPGCQRLECTDNRLTIEEANAENGLVYDKLIMRYWDTWRDGQRPQLFVVPLRNGLVDEEPRNVLQGLEAAVPAYPYIGASSYVFTADNEAIIFSTKIRDENESWSVNTDLYRFRLDGRRQPENLTRSNPASDDRPIVSPDGKWLAWLATEGATRWGAPYRIKVMELRNGRTRTLETGYDISPSVIRFTPDSGSIAATADYFGKRPLFVFGLDGGRVLHEQGLGTVHDFAATANGFIAAASSLVSPADLYLAGGENTIRLTNANAGALAAIEMGDYEQFSFAGANGDTVYGYVVNPAGYSEKRKYPVAFIIHGGPHGSMGDNFHYRWNPQTYAGAGYAVVFIDFHGSTGYGAAFTESVHNNRGGAPLEDLQKGLAAALNRYPWLDGDRVCALGPSYGGYLVNLIAGQWPERFRCLVTHDGMFDNRMKYYAGDIIGYLEEGFGGGPYFEEPAAHEQFNPANHVANWQTPMLVIHGEKDYRVPITHGIAAFTAAQRKGIPSRFVYFPDENHWVQKPNNSVQWHREVTRWLDRWLKR